MLIDVFNEARKNISAGSLKVGDESTSAILFLMTEKGKLPHLSHIVCRPEPLGTYFKTIDYSFTGYLVFIQVQR